MASSSRRIIRPLHPSDFTACVTVENTAFTNPDYRASPDKIAYRLAACPEISLGIFQLEDGKLLGHIISTRSHEYLASDASMDYPKDWKTNPEALRPAKLGPTASPIGHQPGGLTVALHSLAVAPEAQHQGIGKLLMQAYIDRVKQQQPPVQRISLICRDYLVDYYTQLGFAKVGPSQAQFGGGGWFDMVNILK